MKNLKNALLALGVLVLALLPEAAPAQVVTTLPAYINNDNTVYDFGNGPIEVRILTGAAAIFTSSGSGTGTASASTALTLTATPTSNPPIVGAFVTCNVPTNCSIPANTTVAAYNGTTGITLSASATVTAAQVNWGAACPTTFIPGVKTILLQVGQPAQSDIPLYTQARVCAAAQYTTGAAIIPFAIGAH
jgi:hypothetical protein